MTETTGGRLLRAEAAALMPLLHTLEPATFDLPTDLPGWSIRDVIAHCAAALGDAVAGRSHGFTPAENEVDVEARRGVPIWDLVAELQSAYAGAAELMDREPGRRDGIALGEWIHGGDIRSVLGRSDAYRSDGVGDALQLLRERTVAREVPRTSVQLTDATDVPGVGEAWRDFELGGGTDPAAGRLRCDVATLFRLVAGRPAAAFELDGVTAADLKVFF